MSCFDNYITISSSIAESRSGLYAVDLPGIDTDLLNGIARSESEDHEDIWATLYKRSYKNLISDASKNIQDKFYLDHKLIARETSSFKEDANSNNGLAGVTLEFRLPKYAKLHIISIGVYAQTSYASGDVIKIYDTDQDGELLETITSAISSGRNTINVDSDYEVDKVFVSFNPAIYTFRQTENKYYPGVWEHWDTVVCDQCLYGDPSFRGSVVQVNGGGLNIKYMVYCSIEKFVCENIKLFDQALLYKIGHEITIERRLGERLNRYTIMSAERWEELEEFYKEQYETNLMNSIKSHNIHEDPYCFQCKNTLYNDTYLP